MKNVRFLPCILANSYVYALLICLTMSGCSREASLPIPEEQLIPVLIDVHAGETAASHLAGDEKDSVMAVYYQQIMEIHEVEREEFDTCVAIIKNNPELAKKIYEKINEELKKKQLRKQ